MSDYPNGPQITVAEIKIRSIQENQTWLGD